MKKLVVILTGLAALSGCSETRQRPVDSSNDKAQTAELTLPDTNLVRDTQRPVATRTDERVSPIEQQTPETKASRVRSAVPRRKRPAVATRTPPASDTAVQGYAPGRTAAADTGSPTTADTTVPPAVTMNPAADTAKQAGDTAKPAADTARTNSAAPDTSLARPPVSDTVADTLAESRSPTGPSDTARSTVSDTTVKPASAMRDTVATTSESSISTRDTTLAPSRSAAARTLPIGTEIHAALDDSITSRRDTVGQQISAHVMENVTGPEGHTLIAAGTPVQLSITRIRTARSKNSTGRLALQIDGIVLAGQLQPVKADIRPIPRELRGRGVTGSDVAKVGGGAAAGAVLGRVVGGNTKGAVIGGVAGAAAGAVVANQTGTRDVVVKAKTPVLLVLTAPLVAP
jgi:hypothetical protein